MIRTVYRWLAAAMLGGAFACAAPQDGSALSEPTSAASLFDQMLAGDAVVDCSADGALLFSLHNENCYVGLCRGIFLSPALGEGVYAGTLPRRTLDPDDPTRSLPTDEPLIVTLRLGEADPVLEQGEILGTLQLTEFESESVWAPKRGAPRTLNCRVARP